MSSAESLFATYTLAVAEKNVDLMVDLFDEDVLLFDAWDQWSMSGSESWRSVVKEWFAMLGSERLTVDFELVQVTATEKMLSASAFVTFTAFSPDGAKVRSNRERLTWVAVLKENGWKIVHAHNSMPVDFNTGKVRAGD